jgi:hypothetical protein
MIARRLSAKVGPDDLVCRWGGDEVVVVRTGLPEELAARGAEISRYLTGTLPIELDGVTHQVTVGAEFGWANYQEGDTPEQLLSHADSRLYLTKTPQPKPEAPPANVPVRLDGASELPDCDALKAYLINLGNDREHWFLGCFAIRSAARVNNHYGFLATDMVLPFLRDEVARSEFGPILFRARGSSLLALVKYPGGQDALERELRRICNIGLEKHLRQKRRASILPIAIGGKLFSAPDDVTVKKVNSFIDLQRAGDIGAPTALAARVGERVLTP